MEDEIRTRKKFVSSKKSCSTKENISEVGFIWNKNIERHY